MATGRAEQINKIIERRRPRAARIAQVQESLRHLSAALYALEHQRARIVSSSEPEISGRLRDIDLSTVQRKIVSEQEALDKLKQRFLRDTLNIGVVGRARQGKSRFLQSLSGLGKTEIPDGDRQHCTGVRSTIYHNPNVSPYGEVWFYSERAFLDEVIAPYYSANQLHLGFSPDSLDEFGSSPLPPLPERKTNFAASGAKYEHLRRYRENLEAYKSLFYERSPRKISTDQIRAYVAQDTLDGQRIHFNYLAVREVKIVCSFPHKDVGQIAMIDMPGLGDTGIGDQERLVKTLGEDIDLVLFLRMPKSTGDYWSDVDVQLYDLARSALTDLPIDRWSFVVLNRTSAQSKNGDNTNNCQDLKDSISSVGHIAVVDCVTADCSNSQEVGGVVIERVLDYLIGNIDDLDKRYASSCQDRLVSLQIEIQTAIEKAHQALGAVMSVPSEFPVFQRLFKELWANLTTGLEGVMNELRTQRRDYNPIFQEYVETALKNCKEDTGIPSLKEIEARRDQVGSYSIAYNTYLHEVRTHLTRHFLLLDDALKLSVDEVKQRVADILISQGLLGELTEARGIDFLTNIAAQIPDNLSRLKLAFQVFASFELSYRGFIQYRIRKSLDELTPDLTSLRLSDRPSDKEVVSYLNALQSETVFKVRLALTEWLSDPSEAVFALVEEFIDQILRAERAEEDWREFYYEVRSEIWSSEFEKLGERSHIRKQWQTSIDRVTQVNQLEALQFLN